MAKQRRYIGLDKFNAEKYRKKNKGFTRTENKILSQHNIIARIIADVKLHNGDNYNVMADSIMSEIRNNPLFKK